MNALASNRGLSADPTKEIDWSEFHFSSGLGQDDESDPLWQVATHYQELKKKANLDPVEIRRLRNMAVEGILRRTLRLIRHFRRKTHLVRVPWIEEQAGEIALLETIDDAPNPLDIRPEDVVVHARREKPLDLVMIMDTSLSMTGRKLALCAVGAAVLALRIRAEAYAIVAFGSTARVIKALGKRMTVKDTIVRILDAPVLGYTNIDVGLRRARAELRGGRAPLKAGILLTDGQYTEGDDPVPAARQFRRLEVLMTEDHNMDRACCEDLARAGHGHVTPVKRYGHLPDRILGLLRTLQR